MSQDRFSLLEFSDESSSSTLPSSPGRDQHTCMAEARSHYLEGDFEQSLRAYSEALKYDKGQFEAWAGQVRCLVALGDFREAKVWAEKACGLFSDVPILESARSRALAVNGLMAEAMTASDGALEKAEKTGLADPHLWLERGACLLANNQLSSAQHCLDKAQEMANDPDWQQRVAYELLEGGQATLALAWINQLVQQRPKRAFAWLMKARCHRRLGQIEAAHQALNQAAELRPNWPMIDGERKLLKRGCWIATLVYGSEGHPQVQALRYFRDSRLNRHWWGRTAIWTYDWSGPWICRRLAQFPQTHPSIRRGFDRFIKDQSIFAGANHGQKA